LGSEGEWTESTKYKYEDGTPRKQFVIEVMYAGEAKSLNLNSTNRSNLTNDWGNDTKEWIGKYGYFDINGKRVGHNIIHETKE
jgi:hypothetical protein